MVRQSCFRRRSAKLSSFVVLGAVALGLSLSVARSSPAYTPDSPEVKAMVDRGHAYLAQTPAHMELGGDCLAGLVFVKDGKDERHPVVARAVKRCKEACTSGHVTDHNSGALYSTGIACIFLCELDPVKYRPEIDYIFGTILKRQMANGGWSYPSYATGDTSQTQYAVLSLWIAQHCGIQFSTDVVDKAAGWLMRTQDPSGGFGYQGLEPVNGMRQNQPETSIAMTAAGMGSMYIAADCLHLGGASGPQRDPTLPAALRLITPETQGKPAPKKSSLNQEAMRRSIAEGDRFFDRNFNIKGSHAYQMYYMYALERYMSFRELAMNIDDPEPAWYNQGVEYLATAQGPNGAFGQASSIGPEVDTAFAVLFLIRGTKKAIEKNVAGEGTLTGGRGLKGNMANARLKDGKVIAPPEKGTVDNLMNILERPNDPEVDALAEFPDGWLSEISPEKLAHQLERLRRLVYAEKFEVRLVAVRALGRSGDYDTVPWLIYALTDPDPIVVRAANDGLRFISRKLDGFPLPAKYTENDRQLIVKRWKDWYKSVNPAAVFLD